MMPSIACPVRWAFFSAKVLQVVEAPDEQQVGDLLDDLQRVGDAAGPEGVPDAVDLALQLAGDHSMPPRCGGTELNGTVYTRPATSSEVWRMFASTGTAWVSTHRLHRKRGRHYPAPGAVIAAGSARTPTGRDGRRNRRGPNAGYEHRFVITPVGAAAFGVAFRDEELLPLVFALSLELIHRGDERRDGIARLLQADMPNLDGACETLDGFQHLLMVAVISPLQRITLLRRDGLPCRVS